MYSLRLVAALATAPFLAVALATTPAAASAGETELATGLHHSAPYYRATGHSEYERGSGHREAEVTVRAPGLAGRWVKVYIDYRRVGSIHMSATGYGHREWSSEHGQYVPFATVGSPVRVRKYSTGALVVSGRYHLKTSD